MSGSAFNPDAYLAEKSAPAAGFDPDAYLQAKTTEDTHPWPIKAAHYAAKALPLAGGIAGGVAGGMGGAAVGLPTGPGAIAAAAAGAGLGAGGGAAAGKGLQHVVDTALGYEKPIENAGDLGAKVKDMAAEGAEQGAYAAGGEVGLPLLARIPGVKQAGKAIVNGLDSLGNKLAARMLKGTATDYKNLGPEGVQKLGDFLLRKNAVKFGAAPSQVAERVAELPQVTGEELGAAIQGLDATGAQISKQGLAGRFLKLAEEAKAGGPGAAPLVAKYEGAAKAVMEDAASTGEPMMSFKQAEKWKQSYQDPINYAKANNTPAEMGQKEIASSARQHVEDAAATAGEGTPLGDQFLKAKEESGLAQQAALMAKGAEGRRMGRNMTSPASVGTSLSASVAAAASGHPGAIPLALATGPAMQFLRARAPAAAAVTAKTAAQKLQQLAASNPAALGRYGGILSGALQEGQQSFDAHSYVLAQTDPDYQELMRHMEARK